MALIDGLPQIFGFIRTAVIEPRDMVLRLFSRPLTLFPLKCVCAYRDASRALLNNGAGIISHLLAA